MSEGSKVAPNHCSSDKGVEREVPRLAALKVAVFGLGYVGAVSAACLASRGHEVWGVDPDELKVGLIASGNSPVVEPGLAPLVADAVAQGRLHATTDPITAVDKADLSLICVGTPSSPTGAVDLSYLERATADIAAGLAQRSSDRFHAVVVRSTVPPGTVQSVVRPALERRLDARDAVGVAMCPEFLREGSGLSDFADPPFTVLGCSDERVKDLVDALFSFLPRPVKTVSVETAEALKYACNAFHAAKVSFTNELARLYRSLGVDARDVMELFCEDDRLNISASYLRPGFAFGGSCLPKDLRSLLFLARMNSVDLPQLAGIIASNDQTIEDVVNRIVADGGRSVAILGLSFKPQTDDLRESPSVRLAETLLGKGFDLRIYDPVIQPERLVGANRAYVDQKLPHLRGLLRSSPAEALAGADLSVVSCKSPEVVESLCAAPPPRILDLDGRLGDAVEALPGYEGAGW